MHQSSENALTSISAYTLPSARCPPSSTVYCSSFPAEGERSTVGSFSFSKSHVLLPMVIRYLRERETSQRGPVAAEEKGAARRYLSISSFM